MYMRVYAFISVFIIGVFLIDDELEMKDKNN